MSHLEPLINVLVHGQDIAIPLGRTRPAPAQAAMAAADRVWPDLFPRRPARKLGGFRFAATDCSWSAGDGRLVEGPIAAMRIPALHDREGFYIKKRSQAFAIMKMSRENTAGWST